MEVVFKLNSEETSTFVRGNEKSVLRGIKDFFLCFSGKLFKFEGCRGTLVKSIGVKLSEFSK